MDVKDFNALMQDAALEFKFSEKQAADYLTLAGRIEDGLSKVANLPKFDRDFWNIQIRNHRSTAAQIGKMVKME